MIPYIMSIFMLLGAKSNTDLASNGISYIEAADTLKTISFSGNILESKGHYPMPYAELVLLQNEEEIAKVFADHEGAFDFKDLNKGVYDFELRYAELDAYRMTNIVLEESLVGNFTAYINYKEIVGVVLDDKDSSSLNITLIDSANNRPISLAIIQLVNNDHIIKVAKTDENGQVQINGVLPATYKIFIEGYGGYQSIVETIVIRNDINKINLSLNYEGGNISNEVMLPITIVEEQDFFYFRIFPIYLDLSYIPSITDDIYIVPEEEGDWNTQKPTITDKYVVFDEPYESYFGVEKGKLIENKPFQAKENKVSTYAPWSMDESSFNNILIPISNGTRPNPNNVRIEELVNIYDYKYTLEKEAAPLIPQATLMDCPWNKNRKLLQLVSSKKVDAGEEENIVVCLTGINQEDELSIKSMLYTFVDRLDDNDRISIIYDNAYSGDVILTPTLVSNKKNINKAIKNLSLAKPDTSIVHYGSGIPLLSLAKQIIKSNPDKGEPKILCLNNIVSWGHSYEYLEQEDTTIQVINTSSTKGFLSYLDDDRRCFKLEESKDINIIFNPDIVKSYRLVGYENRADPENNQEYNTRKQNDMIFISPKRRSIDEYNDYFGDVFVTFYEIELESNVDIRTNPIADIEYSCILPQQTNKLIQAPLYPDFLSINACNKDTRWAIAVATWGMLLRDSKYNKHGKLKNIIPIAKAAQGDGWKYEKTIQMMEASRAFLK